MSLFKKPKSKINVRVTRDDSDDDDKEKKESIELPVDEGIDSFKKSQLLTSELQSNVDSVGTGIPVVLVEPSSASSFTKPSSQQPVLGEKKFDPKAKLKLSFGDDEEEVDVFQVKKSAYSRRIAKQMKREKKRKEKEEKAEEAKRIEKSSNSEQIFSFNQNNKEDEKSDAETSDSFPPPTFKEPSIPFKEISSHQFKPVKEGQFPSAKEIYAARKKREEDRKKMKMDNIIEDFISVEEETAAERAALGHMDDEQPVYEEEGDGDDDDDEDDDRINFAVDREAMERERAKEAFIQAQEEDEDTINNRNRDNKDSDDSENEIDLWEKEQIRKGVGFSIGSTNRDQQPNNQLNDLMTKLDLPSTSEKSSSFASIPSYLPKNPSSKAIKEHIEQLSHNISETIRLIDASLSHDLNELEMVKDQRENLEAEVAELEIKLKESQVEDNSNSFWKKEGTFMPMVYDTYKSSDSE